MKATAHWLELKGHTEKKPSTIFDEAFAEQVFDTGKIEDGAVLRQFFARTKQPLFQDWLVALVRGLASRLPISLLMKLGFATLSIRGPVAGTERAPPSPSMWTSGRLPIAVPWACMRRERSDERQLQKSRILSGLRAGRHRPRLQPFHQGTRQGSRSSDHRTEEWNCCGAMEVKNIDPKLQTYLRRAISRSQKR